MCYLQAQYLGTRYLAGREKLDVAKGDSRRHLQRHAETNTSFRWSQVTA